MSTKVKSEKKDYINKATGMEILSDQQKQKNLTTLGGGIFATGVSLFMIVSGITIAFFIYKFGDSQKFD